MPLNSYGTFKGHAGFALESAYGSTVAAPVVWLPYLSLDDYTDDQGHVYDETVRAKASKLYAVYDGVEQGKWGMTFPYYPTAALRFWARLLGLDTIVSSSNGGWQHSITLADLPYSETAFLFFASTGNASRGAEVQFVGSQYTSLNFKFSRATGMATIKVTAISAAPSTGIAETVPVYSSEYAFRGWQGVFSVAGSTRVTLLDYDITVSREADLIFAANNSQRPSNAEVGTLDVTGKLRMYGSTDQPYTDYRANTQQSLDLVMVDSLGGSTMNRLEILLSKSVFTKVTPDMSGNYLVYDAEFRGVHNSSAGGDSGPFQILSTIATSSALSS